MRKDRIVAGPAFGTVSVRAKKIPVPTVAPTPSMVSEKSPSERLSPLSLPPPIGLVRISLRPSSCRFMRCAATADVPGGGSWRSANHGAAFHDELHLGEQRRIRGNIAIDG